MNKTTVNLKRCDIEYNNPSQNDSLIIKNETLEYVNENLINHIPFANKSQRK